MALVYTEEQQLLRDSAKEFLSERCSVADFRALRDAGNPGGYAKEAWDEMGELGWSGVIIPEEHDGLEFGYVGAGIIFEEMGRNLSCSPLFATAVVGASIIAAGGSESQKAAVLPEVAAGEKLLALALEDSGHHGHGGGAAATAKDGGYVINAEKKFVLDGCTAQHLIVAADVDGARTLFLVDGDAAGVTRTSVAMVDYRAADDVSLVNVQVGADAVIGDVGGGDALLQPALDKANLVLAAELLGISQECFQRTAGYLRERKQFGVPIGVFQALQHRAAHLYCEIELLRSVVLKGLQAADEGAENLSLLASLAKAKACKTAESATNEGIQMHGGIGMTDEFDIGFFIKRARVAQQTFGDYHYHARRVAQLKGY